jgi:hypothetical protein
MSSSSNSKALTAMMGPQSEASLVSDLTSLLLHSPSTLAMSFRPGHRCPPDASTCHTTSSKSEWAVTSSSPPSLGGCCGLLRAPPRVPPDG